jgi:hypothetical protein
MLIPKDKPWRSKKYLAWVRTQPCVVSGGKAHAHHIIGHGYSTMGSKPSDMLTFPLSPYDHDLLHHHGWREWERVHGSQLLHVLRTIDRAIKQGIVDIV